MSVLDKKTVSTYLCINIFIIFVKIKTNIIMKEIQFGQALTADFEKNTFTFEMQKDFTVHAGKYAIIPMELYDEIRNDLEILKEELNKELLKTK